MIYGFDTNDEHAATGALLVYAIYRSRDKGRFSVSLDMWDRIERFTKDAAKRAKTLPEFVEALKPRLSCGSIQPRYMAIGKDGVSSNIVVYEKDGRLREVRQTAEVHQREFLAPLIQGADACAVIRALYATTAFVVLLVRDRIEREKPLERVIESDDPPPPDCLPPEALLALKPVE